MKKVLFSLAAVGAIAFMANTASAQCAFDNARKAKGVKSDMVRAYSACPGVTFTSPNTSTMAGIPGCAPPTPISSFNYDDKKGKCKVSTGQKLESPCSTGTGIDCANLTIKVKCGGITEADNTTPITSGIWSLNTVARATFDDNSSGDMTVIDFPAQFAFDPPNKGKISLQSDTNTLLNDLFGPGSELPGCTAIELITLKIADPAGDQFATIGSSSR